MGGLVQVRSGMRAYAGAARRRVHLVMVLHPPSGHRPGRHEARHAQILQIGLRSSRRSSRKGVENLQGVSTPERKSVMNELRKLSAEMPSHLTRDLFRQKDRTYYKCTTLGCSSRNHTNSWQTTAAIQSVSSSQQA